ncbi:MAG: hypothetical protein NC348_06605 [Clostridium sp.]|nr:hypothetical protein [Clostridium sp.]
MHGWKRGFSVWMGLFTLVLLSGCGGAQQGTEEDIAVSITDYQKNSFQTVTVKQGTIEPVLTMKLKPDAFESVTYSIKQEMLEVDEVLVEKGTQVKAGEVMVTFKSGDTQKNIEEYEERKAEDELLIEHYRKLMSISSEEDYTAEIKKLENDLNVASLYIAEQKAKLSQYRLVADKDGAVTSVHEDLLKGYATSGKALVTVASGSSNYTAATTDDYAFKTGDVYKAKLNMVEYEMRVISAEKKGEQTIISFEPVSDMAGVLESDELLMTIEKGKIPDALYVETSAVKNVEESPYVYRMDEQGFREVVPVTVGETVDQYTVIKKGLAKGEQVVVN